MVPHGDPLVYFLRCPPFIKIGLTADLPRRLINIQAASAFPVTLVHVVRASRGQSLLALEASFHSQFAAYRDHGEWFRDEGNLHAFLEVPT